MLYWRRPNGRISHYLLTVTEDESGTKLLEEYMTNEQFVTLPSKSPGKLSIEVRMHDLNLWIFIYTGVSNCVETSVMGWDYGITELGGVSAVC